MSRCSQTPIIAVVIGEGGSGGALALGVADRVLMLENSVYSVITPEGCAAILWKDASQRERGGARRSRSPREDLLRLKVIDEIVQEPLGGAHVDPEPPARRCATPCIRHVTELRKLQPREAGPPPSREVRARWAPTPRPE